MKVGKEVDSSNEFVEFSVVCGSVENQGPQDEPAETDD